MSALHRALPLLLLPLLPACAHRRVEAMAGATDPTQAPPNGPRRASLDLYRPTPEGEKVFVEVDLGDGQPRIFLVDTGASVSTLTADVARELRLELGPPRGTLVGLGGSSPWVEARADRVKLGPYAFEDVTFAVDVAGVPDRAGVVPVAGLLGNNIWQHFVVAVDYPSDTLDLALPGGAEVPATAVPMTFDGQHISTDVLIEAEREGLKHRELFRLELDTGARELVLSSSGSEALARVSTEGWEPIYGIGAGDDLPPSYFLRQTRRLEVRRVELGGAVVEEELQAMWVNYQPGGPTVGPAQMPGLVGHEVLDEWRAVFDYPGRRFALVPSEHKPRHNDLNAWQLKQLDPRAGGVVARQRALLLLTMEREAEARAELDKEHARDPSDTTTSIMLARLQRHMGQDEAALELLLKLAVADLVDQDEIIAVVNSLCLRGKSAEAVELARRATVDRPRHTSAWVALSDVLRQTGDPAGARSALQRANQLDENPDGHLLRRAWIAQEEGDIYGLVTHSRRLMELYPNGGVAPWFYASQVKGTPQAELWKMDATRAVGRLHPGDGALDFYGAGWHHVGDAAMAQRLIDTGRARDCKLAREEAGRANCEAWYSALRRDALNEARKQVEGALASHPSRSEYLDTLAMVAEAQGDLAAAQSAALKAARLNPDDIYLLWQAERLTEAASGGKR